MQTLQRIEEMNNGRYPLGVTGSIGCGKSHACKMLIANAKKSGLESSYIDLDSLRREILGIDPDYKTLREKLGNKFGVQIVKQDGSIDREELSQIIFNDEKSMRFFKQTIDSALYTSLQKNLSGKKGLVLVEWALLAEDGLLPLVDNNALLVKCSYAQQKMRLKGGDLSEDQIIKRINFQLNNEEKEQKIREIQEKTGKGQLHIFDTTNDPQEKQYEILLEKVILNIR